MVDRIALSGDFSQRVPVGSGGPGPDGGKEQVSGDELDALATQFNKHGVGALSDSQLRLLEARRAEAQASIAAQVAHDIRRPAGRSMEGASRSGSFRATGGSGA